VDTSEYLGLFLDESRESLQALNASLLDLERDPADAEPLTVIFRVAHSLKGMSATMGFEAMARLTHRMEEVLAAMRDDGAPVTPAITDSLFACLDTLQEMVDRVAASDTTEVDASGVLSRLDAIAGSATASAAEATDAAGQADEAAPAPAEEAEPAIAEAAATTAPAPVADSFTDYDRMIVDDAHERGMDVLRVAVVFEEGCSLAAARAFMVVQELEAFGDLIKSEPDAESIEAGEVEGEAAFWIIVESGADPEEIRARAAGVSEIASCVVEPFPAAAAAGEPTVDEAPPADATPEAAPAVEASTPEGSAPADPTPADPAPADAAPADTTPAVPAAPAPAAAPAERRSGGDRRAPAAGEGKGARNAATVRVGTDRLDELMNLMGEMVIQRTRLAQLSGDHALGDLQGAVEDMTRVTNDLQTLIMQVRMMPVEAVFMRFPRMVRDLANTLDKKVELVISGEDTELDRTVIDGLGDPLVHMLRNAVDHGLESPDQRVAAGKSPTGTVHLSAQHAGNNVVIVVRDDGRGMDPAALRASVVRKNLMDEETARALSDDEALQLVFLPGFSTAEQTTDVSGRGVGMDAVRTAITDLNGEVTISSTPGVGSSFTIRLPLTLAIIQALLVKSGPDPGDGSGQVWAIPLEAIEETVILRPSDARPVGGRPCIVLRDSIVPLVWLSDRLGLGGDGALADDDDPIEVVVVRDGSQRVGLVVDDLVGKQDVVIKHLPGYLGDVGGVAGATILGDGSVALIVDMTALLPSGVRSVA